MKKTLSLALMACLLLAACATHQESSSLPEAPSQAPSQAPVSTVQRPPAENSLQQLCWDLEDAAFPLHARLDLTGPADPAAQRVETTPAFCLELAKILAPGIPFPKEDAPDTYMGNLLMEGNQQYFWVMQPVEEVSAEALAGKCLLRIDSQNGDEMTTDYYSCEAEVYHRVQALWDEYTVGSLAEIEGDALKLEGGLPVDSYTSLAAEAGDRLGLLASTGGGTPGMRLLVYSLADGEKLDDQEIANGVLGVEHSSYAGSQLRVILDSGQIAYYDLQNPGQPTYASLNPELFQLRGAGDSFDIDPESGMAAVESRDRLTWQNQETGGPLASFACQDIPAEHLEGQVENPEFFFSGCKLLKGGRLLFTTIQLATPGGQSDSALTGVLLYDIEAKTPHYIMDVFSSWNTGFEFEGGTRLLGLGGQGATLMEVDLESFEAAPAGPAGLEVGPGTANYLYRDYAVIQSEMIAGGAEESGFYVNGAATPLLTVTNSSYATYIRALTRQHLLFQVQDSTGVNLYIAKYR